jgi:hypothetical protein
MEDAWMTGAQERLAAQLFRSSGVEEIVEQCV